MSIKKVFTVCFILTVTVMVACAQKNEVPKAVADAFAQKFPDISKVKWDKENDTEWEAEFKLNSVEYSAIFENNGTWKETEHEINMSEIPEAVTAVLTIDYADYKVKESEISETSEGMVYEFEIKNGKTEMEIAIDKSGRVTKKEEKHKDTENDDED